jgi:hypothetical protein
LNAVTVEIALEVLAIGQLDPAASFLRVVHQHALVVLPVVLQQFKVGVVEWAVELDGFVVVDLAVAVELVLQPIALVGELAACVVEFAIAVHLVVLPGPFVEASILVVELASSVAHTVALEALIATTRVVFLLHVLFLLRL